MLESCIYGRNSTKMASLGAQKLYAALFTYAVVAPNTRPTNAKVECPFDIIIHPCYTYAAILIYEDVLM